MTIGVIVITVGILGWFTWIFFEPSTPLNPLPVPTMPVLAVPPTRTPELSPTPTQTPTPEPTVTPTVTPTATPQPTIVAATPVTTPPTLTPTDAYSNYPFVVYGEITSIEAALMHPAEGCNWQGIAGQVFNTKGAPILYTGVQIGGRFNGRQISEIILTGYGPDYVQYGYEYKLADQPVASDNTLWVRLVDQANLPLSDKVYLKMEGDCAHNLILLNFKQVR